ncbi:MAG: DUF1540 domain-containing protein [Eubacteriales bacterium]|nr:DUF1540 domain-containing protein [Eubacteriales bacterium]
MKKQSIGCQVHACRHNDRTACELSHIDVRPCRHCQSGEREDASMCDSFEPRGDE